MFRRKSVSPHFGQREALLDSPCAHVGHFPSSLMEKPSIYIKGVVEQNTHFRSKSGAGGFRGLQIGGECGPHPGTFSSRFEQFSMTTVQQGETARREPFRANSRQK